MAPSSGDGRLRVDRAGGQDLLAQLRLAERHPEGVVLLFVHGGVIEQAIKLAMGVPSSARLRLRTEHCSLTEIEIDQGEVRLLRYNDRAPRDVTAR